MTECCLSTKHVQCAFFMPKWPVNYCRATVEVVTPPLCFHEFAQNETATWTSVCRASFIEFFCEVHSTCFVHFLNWVCRIICQALQSFPTFDQIRVFCCWRQYVRLKVTNCILDLLIFTQNI